MLYNALSTLGMSRSLQSTMTRQQMELTRANEEVSTGVHADVAATIGAGTGRDIALRNLFDRTDEYVKTTDLLDGRMKTMDSAMTSILASGTDLLAAASTGLGQQSPTGTSLQIRARGVLDQVVGLLNASSGNSYLFAGTALDQPPMRNVDGDKSGLRSPMQIVRDAIQSATGGTAMPITAAETAAVVARLDELFAVRDPATPAPAPLTDTFEGGLYTGTTTMQPGGSASPRVAGQPAESTGIAYGVQANDPMMRQMLEGIYMLAAVDTSQMEVDAYPDYIRTAVDKLSGGLGKLREATAQLGIQRAQVAALAEQHKTQKSVLSLQIDNLEGVDPYEASTRISQLEAQIDATSSATARIAKLHLTNYL
ncbi:flagellar hook protein [Azospirillum sp. YIM B02556]|uniref:Flagellin n=1 Tax=Azospirillum endophyticum TaxID=2800326 RepID=A0ABS1FBL9_9PROT|nr:flagellin [Azospirillum endophyticum]MBK1840833.1 flagellar hook protein [Azospirillum endophyticum]